MNPNTATEYRNLPLNVLTESTTNPRHIFEDAALKELAESIRVQGVLSPLLVRPLTGQGFEIVAGARRYRAAQIAEAATVPVRIVNLTDAEAMEAARAFLLVTTIRDLRREGPTHRSMLINVSHFTAVQDQITDLLHTWLSQKQQDIRNYSQLSISDALRNSNLSALHGTWQREFAATGFDWETVQEGLVEGVLPISVRAVNQRTGAASLDFKQHQESGLRVMVVGGNSLSRGLTLEGLSTSYFFRFTKMYDSLLQMGRWFGYRDGYEDLCRIWLTDEVVECSDRPAHAGHKPSMMIRSQGLSVICCPETKAAPVIKSSPGCPA